MAELLRDKYGRSIQAFPLIEGKISVGATDGVDSDGVFTNIDLICCIEDGGFTITFKSTNTKAVTMVAGDICSVLDGAQIKITSGSFHLA